MLVEPKNRPKPACEEAASAVDPQFEELLLALDEDFARLAFEVDPEEFDYRSEEEEYLLLAAGQTC